MEEHQLFKPERRARYNEYIKGKIRKFIIGYKELEMYFTIGSNPYNRESLKFYSDLFKSMSSQLSEITCYMDGNKLISKREKLKRSIDLFEKVLGLMKVLDQRYLITITSPDPTEDPRWYKESDKTNKEIIEKIIILLYEINSLKPKKDRG